MVPTGSWPDAPSSHIIIGLKELPKERFPLKQYGPLTVPPTIDADVALSARTYSSTMAKLVSKTSYLASHLAVEYCIYMSAGILKFVNKEFLHEGFENSPQSYITIDHIPSLLPRETSKAFSTALLPNLLELEDRMNAPMWRGAGDLFKETVAELDQKNETATGSTTPAQRQ